jgi:hypothetical protein
VWTFHQHEPELATTVTLLSAAICLPAAYAFARMDFPGRNILFFSFLAGQAFPKFGLLIAIAGIFLNLGLIGTFWGVVLIQLVGTLLFMIWIPVAAFQSVDRRMEEAARDVGASPFRVLPIHHPAPGWAHHRRCRTAKLRRHLLRNRRAWLIGAPQIRTLPVLMISFINNQPVIQYGACVVSDTVGPFLRRAPLRAARHWLGQLRPRLRGLRYLWRFSRSGRSARFSGPSLLSSASTSRWATASSSASSAPRARASPPSYG